MERRKERARVYSHIARRRQEGFMKDLKEDVEHLTVFRLLVEEGPDCIMVLSSDLKSKVLFIEGAVACGLSSEPQGLLGR